MSFLVLGGSFNPVHIGHLIMAEEVATQFGYGRVILVPAFMPPHKDLVDDPGPEHRLAMLRLAVVGQELFSVDDCELRRGGPSYTVDTLADLIARLRPDGRPALLIGDDLAEGFTSWREPGRILGMARLIVARRSGLSYELGLAHESAGNLLVPISSTLVRQRVRDGGAWKNLVPPGVASYMDAHGLYRN
ncbi:MAG TPA: nicotinate (nicotinamide) nucleotide adenylyltransferase [Spirochaetales bacterium]|nr:nicotinate (nicotinamide) nucleotide adenylyltransferase [Spirochaetales bacterium]